MGDELTRRDRLLGVGLKELLGRFELLKNFGPKFRVVLGLPGLPFGPATAYKYKGRG